MSGLQNFLVRFGAIMPGFLLSTIINVVFVSLRHLSVLIILGY
jgi:hypothetical protein